MIDCSELTEREIDIFVVCGLGYSASECANLFGLSIRTVESHRQNISGKLQVPGRHWTRLMIQNDFLLRVK